MKIINIDVDSELIVKSVYDTDTKSEKNDSNSLKFPTGNYKTIMLNFNFISPKFEEVGLNLFASFKNDFLDDLIIAELTSITEGERTYEHACYIPEELLSKVGEVKLGLFGYILNEETQELEKRYSLKPISSEVVLGSFQEDMVNASTPTPTMFEVYLEKLNKIIEEAEDKFNNMVPGEGGGSVDLSNYAKKSDLHSHNNKNVLDNITSAKVTSWDNKSTFSGSYDDLTGKPTIPTKTSQLTNDNQFVSEGFVTNAIANAQLGGGDSNIDLSGYATKDDLLKKADTSAIPTKVSQLENDSKYLTSIPSEYITETELNNKGYLTQHQDISNLAKRSELHSHSNKSVLDSITQTNITNWNNKSTFSGNYDDLSNKPTIPTVPTNISAFTNDSGYLTSKLKGKKITVVGDSLSTGYTVGKNWVNMLAERTGAIVVNLATDGATIAKRENDNSNNFPDKLQHIPSDTDYIVLMGGGNDMMKSVPTGNRHEKNNMYTVSGAIFQIIAYLQMNFPTVKIMFITEPPIGAEMHDAYDPYNNIILEICEMGHIPCFNMHSNFGLNPNIPQIREIYWLEDYVHLTETGQQYMSQKIQNFLENEVVNNNKNATSINGYKLMILSASEYNSLSKKDENTIYITKDNKAYLGSLLILGGGTTSSGDSGDDTTNEGAIDTDLWNTFFKIKKYAGTDVINNNPTLEFSGGATGALITNLSEEEATYAYNAPISHVATTLEAGKTITIELEVESTNVKTLNMGFYHTTGSFGPTTEIGGQQGTFSVSIENTTSSTVNINGIGCMIDVNDSTGYTVKMTIKSITIS